MSIKEKLWWVPDDHEVWSLAAQIGEEMPNGCVNFMIQKSQKIISHQLQKCLPASRDTVGPEDLVYLHDVNQASILHCIRTRFQERKIYTNIGMVLMTINPFEVIGGLYGKSMMKKYEDPMDRTQNAHVYSIPARAYYNMCSSGEDQSILISGESGAGKTEAAKQCLAFLTEVANSRAAQELAVKTDIDDLNDTNENGLSITEIANRIISASPILEAFGNAKTSRNPNSSRFGKWMVLNFDRHNLIHSASIVSYLLEKSRVTQRESQERNYHIFYQILRGLSREQLKAWKLQNDTRMYRYIQADGDSEAIDLNDARNFRLTQESFMHMGFTAEETLHYFQITMGILQLGNIDFISTKDGEASEIRNLDLLEDIAHKIGVNSKTLAFALCNRSFETGKTRKSVVQIQLNVHKAVETRDSLARSLYERLFTDIINSINSKSKINSHQDGHGRCIGLLDIFGFEIFQENSFEQLCINYCNEMLQHHFDYVIFTSEKNLYSQEGIVCETIEFKDNTDVIRDIENIFKALDEESRIPKGSAKQWYDKMKKTFKTAHVLFPPRRKGDIFLIKHYAGDVEYNPVLFLEKNVETLNNDLVGTMSCSTDSVMMRLFAKTNEDIAKANDVNNGSVARRAAAGAGSTLSSKSLSFRFVQQLGTLMGMLRKTHSHFIRCVKSNDACMAQRFEPSLVYKQLLYSGVFEVVKIQQSGLPCRMPHMDFVHRYRCLAPSRLRWNFNSSNELLSCLSKMNFDLTQARVGVNLIFFKSFEQKFLETKRESLLRRSASKFTCFLLKKKYLWAFSDVIKYFRQFREGNENLSTVEATPAFEAFQKAVENFHRIRRKPCLQHVVEHMEHELSLLDQRCELIHVATERLTNRTKEGVISLQEILGRAIDLEITYHAIILQCKDTSQQYYRAIEFVDVVHRSDPDISKYTTSYIPSPFVLHNLTSDQIQDGVKLLREFETVVDDAPIALNYASLFLESVQHEIMEMGNPIQRLLSLAVQKFDADAGIMVQTHGDEGLEAFAELKDMVEQLQDHHFNSRDVENLFQDAADLVLAMDDYVNKGDATTAIEIMEAATHHRQVSQVFLNQLHEIKQWAEIQNSPEKLRSLLLQGYVPGSQVGNEDPVVFEEIEALVEKLRKLTQPTPAVEGVVRAGHWIVQFRKLFLEKNWEELEKIITDADQDGVENNIFEEYQDCIIELNNCQWQVIYHGFFGDVVSEISELIFRSVTLDSDSWHLMIADINDDLDMVQGIKSFVVAETAPKLYKLLPLLEDIVNLRSLVYSKETDIAKTVVQQIQDQYMELLEEFQLKDAVNGELLACQRLLKKIELERQLLEAMRLYKAKRYTCINEHQLSPYKAGCDLTETVNALEKAIQNLADFAEKYDNQLENYLVLARKLLSGRGKLIEDELSFVSTVDWRKIHDAFVKDDPVIMRETVLFYDFEEEISLITEELHRRYLLVSLRQILHTPAIVGTVDVDVHTDEKLLIKQFKAFNAAMIDMKEHKSKLVYPKNLINLSLYVKGVLQFRKKLLENCWNKRDEIEHFIAYLRQIGDGGGRSITTTVDAELVKVSDELEARLQIKRLRKALETIEVSHKEEETTTATNVTHPPNVPPVDSNEKDNPSNTVLVVNLMPLKAAISIVEKYQGNVSKKLVALAKDIVRIVEILLANSSARIDDTEIEAASKAMKELHLDATNVDMVFDNVRVHNFLKNIRVALIKHSDDPGEMLSAIVSTRNAIKNLPGKYIPWLRVAYLYCDIALSLQENDWVRLVETTRHLDDYLTLKIHPLIEQDRQDGVTSFNNWNDVVKFIDVITHQRNKGYNIALKRKRSLDEAEKEKVTQTMSPVEAQKAQIRADDFQQNLYGLGQLRKSGYSDKKLAQLAFDPRLFWAYDFDVSLLRRLRKFCAMDLIRAGYTVQELYRGGYTVQDMYRGGMELSAMELSPKELLQAGIPMRDIFEQMMIHPQQIRDLENDAKKLLSAGLTLGDLMEAGFNLLELRGAGFNAADLYHAGFDNVNDFLVAGYDLKQIACNFPLADLRRSGVLYSDLRNCGYSLEELLNAGYFQEVERDVMILFFQQMQGSYWISRRGWCVPGKVLSEWEGIVLEKDEADRERIVAIDLVEHGLRGNVPVELCLLQKLKSLHLSGNFIMGRLPERLASHLRHNQIDTDMLISASPFGSPDPSSPAPRNLSLVSRRVPPPPPALSVDTTGKSNDNNSDPSKESLMLKQRQSLLELFHNLQGTAWRFKDNWCSEKPISEWYGIKVSATTGHVIEINLASNNLRGILPLSLASFKRLQILDLRLNQIHGVIPNSLGQCSNLQKLYLQSNKLAGNVPDILGHLTNLQILDLRNNMLDGRLPTDSLSRLVKLTYLGLRSNLFFVGEVEELRRLLPACRIAW